MRSAMTEAVSDVLVLNGESDAEKRGPGFGRHHVGIDRARGAGAGSMITMAAAAVLAVAGLFLVGQGLWIHAKGLLAQVLLERAFTETLVTGRPVKPWSWADTWPVA